MCVGCFRETVHRCESFFCLPQCDSVYALWNMLFLALCLHVRPYKSLLGRKSQCVRQFMMYKALAAWVFVRWWLSLSGYDGKMQGFDSEYLGSGGAPLNKSLLCSSAVISSPHTEQDGQIFQRDQHGKEHGFVNLIALDAAAKSNV